MNAILSNNTNNYKDNEFIRNLKCIDYRKRDRILDLQNKYKAGIIKEEDMTQEELESLIELYQKQNERLKQRLEEKRIRIRRKLNELKNKK